MSTHKTNRRPTPVQHTRPVRDPARVDALIYPRRIAAQLLSVSAATLIRMEQTGRLTPLKLMGPSGQTFYRRAEIEALIDAR